MADNVGSGNLDDVRSKLLEVALHGGTEAKANAILGAPRNRDGRDADKVACGLERRSVGRRRIDADVHALAEQIADQPVQRLVGAVPNIIVIARKQGDADLVWKHGQQQLMVKAAKAMHGRS